MNDKIEDNMKLVVLRDYVTSFSGGTPTSTHKEYYDGSINFIGSGEIGQNYTAKKINDFALSNSSAKMVKPGDILYAMYGATAGNLAITPIEGAINQAILCIRPNHNIHKMYLYFQLEYMKSKILNRYIQGGQGNLSSGQILSLEIKKPKLETQNKYAKLLSSMDKLIESIDATRIFYEKVYAQIKENHFKDIISKKSNYKLKDIIEKINTDKSVDNSKYRKITCSLHGKGIKFLGETAEMKDKRPFYIRRNDEILIGKQNYFNGSIAIITEEFNETISSNALVSFSIKSYFDTKYIFEYLKNPNYMRRRSVFANGTGQKELSEKDLFDFDFYLINKCEQYKFSELFSMMNELLKQLEEYSTQLKKQKKYYLNEIFN